MKTNVCTSIRRLWWVALSALPLLALLSLQPTWAAKPPKPPPPPPAEGIIYFYAYWDGMMTYSMAPDGSDTVVVIQGLQQFNHPSVYLHGGERWFTGMLPIEGQFYPDGKQRYELCAISESGTIVQLSDDPTVQPQDFGDQPGPSDKSSLWDLGPQWTLADTSVSFIGRRWGVDPATGEDVIVEEGMFVIALTDDIANGPPPVQPEWLPLELLDYAHSYEWSPDCTTIAYAAYGLYVVDVATGLSEQIVPLSESGSMAHPSWTPDGLTIVFQDNELRAIRKVSADGTGLTTIAAYDRRTGHAMNPVVSPDGTLVAFQRVLPPKNQRQLSYTAAIYVVDINGANEMKIKDMHNYLECTGWRE
jgi:hypothetical protein